MRKASSNHNVPVKVIGDVYGDEEISNYFASKYEDLYSSVSYSHTNMLDVVGIINARIEKLEMSHFNELTVENVMTAVNPVKSGKKMAIVFYLLIILKMQPIGCMSYSVCC